MFAVSTKIAKPRHLNYSLQGSLCLFWHKSGIIQVYQTFKKMFGHNTIIIFTNHILCRKVDLIVYKNFQRRGRTTETHTRPHKYIRLEHFLSIIVTLENHGHWPLDYVHYEGGWRGDSLSKETLIISENVCIRLDKLKSILSLFIEVEYSWKHVIIFPSVSWSR